MRVLNSKFLSEKGESLSVRLTLPRDKMPVHFAMIAHCFTCNKDFNNVRNISKAMTASGFGVLSLDFTGLGSSNGNFADTNFSTNVDDLVAAANYLKKKYVSPSLIIGHSFGGPAAIYAADKIPSVKAVATIAAPSQVDHVKHLLGDEIDVIKEEGKGTASISGNSITIKKQFLHDIDQHNLTEVVRELRKPILIMHSPQDCTVDIRHAEMLYTEAKHPKSFISLNNADHLLNNKKDACYAGDVIAAWVKRYLTAKP
jgi:putative redox protein